MTRLIEIEGIGEVSAHKLEAMGVTSIELLLEKGATPKGRQEMAENTGMSHKLILQWVNHADLYRIRGIGSEYSDLLEAAGVDTVPELAQRSPERLVEKMTAANEQKKIVRRLPVLSQVTDWIEQAKKLDRIVQY